MRAGHRERDQVKGSSRHRAKNLGAAFSGLMVVLMGVSAAFGLGVAPLLSAERDRTIRRQLLSGQAASTADTDGPVVLRGRVDPNQLVPVGGGGLALFQRESMRIDFSWDWELVYHPEFELVLADGSVRVVNDCHREESDWAGHLFNVSWTLGIGLDRCYRLGGKWAVAYDRSGHRRYLGFGPGHEVRVVGTLHGGRLQASAVFGGSPEDYAATLKGNVWPLVIGVALGLFLVAGSVMVAYMVICCMRGAGVPPASRERDLYSPSTTRGRGFPWTRRQRRR